MGNISEFLVKHRQAASVYTVSLGIGRIDSVGRVFKQIIVKLNVISSLVVVQ